MERHGMELTDNRSELGAYTKPHQHARPLKGIFKSSAALMLVAWSVRENEDLRRKTA